MTSPSETPLSTDERIEAVAIVNRLLDEPYADPDDDIRVVCRQFQRLRERATFPPQRSDPATWVLLLLLNKEISVAKAGEWLRHYIQDGVQDPLPKVEALP